MNEVKNGRYVDEDGDVTWYKDGVRHREDGPAYEGLDGAKSWWINGQRHREDGPAVEFEGGCESWYAMQKEKKINLQNSLMDFTKNGGLTIFN